MDQNFNSDHANDTTVLCYCTDYWLATAIIREKNTKKFELLGLTREEGFGQRVYETKIGHSEYDEIIPYNSTIGISFVALRTGSDWQILEFIYNLTYQSYVFFPEYLHFESVPAIKKYLNENKSLVPAAWKMLYKGPNTDWEKMRELRKVTYWETVNYGEVILKEIKHSFNGADSSKSPAQKAILYTNPKQVSDSKRFSQTLFRVLEMDSLYAAKEFINAGRKPLVLNMANRQTPGGGVLNGAGAQEENLMRRTTLYASLFQFAPFARQYRIEPSQQQYPLDRNTGGVYTPDIIVFRHSEDKHYQFMEETFKVDIVSVAALPNPGLVLQNEKWRISNEFIAPIKEKIRTILRIANLHGHSTIVLGAFGCGAFRNPPAHVAELFQEVFNEREFLNCFEEVVFAILDDHNAHRLHNPEGNLIPFQRIFG